MGLGGAIGTHPGEGIMGAPSLGSFAAVYGGKEVSEESLSAPRDGMPHRGLLACFGGAWPSDGQSGRILVPPPSGPNHRSEG